MIPVNTRFPRSVSRVIVPQTPALRRHGEGTAVRRRSGGVYLVYSRFTGGGADHDTAELVGAELDLPEGRLREPRVLFPAPGALNQMSASLERLADGDWGFVWIRKTAPDADEIYFSRSPDEGRTWSAPVPINRGLPDRYFVVNNDRLRQFGSGRLAVPVCIYPGGHTGKTCDLAMFYSDDGGGTWGLSQRVRLLKEAMIRPETMGPGSEAIWAEVCAFWGYQEPGVEELADGRILMYCRTTNGYMYQAYSGDGGLTWSPLRAAPDIVTCCGPQSIRRLPGSHRLLCVFNDHRGWPFNVNHPATGMSWNWRTPQSVAVSDDHGATWRVLGDIEDASHNYCYTSILFLDDTILLTFYESENTVEDGRPQRRNLASLKMHLLHRRDLLP